MEVFTVSFFGHRQLDCYFDIEKQLETMVRNIITSEDYVEFLVGRDGDFDQIASSTIRRIMQANDYGNSSLILILPYMTAEYRNNQDNFHKYYDDVEICSKSAKSHYKAAIQVRNRYMIDRSDLVICYIEQKSGGAYKSLQYALTQGKNVKNIAYPTIFE